MRTPSQNIYLPWAVGGSIAVFTFLALWRLDHAIAELALMASLTLGITFGTMTAIHLKGPSNKCSTVRVARGRLGTSGDNVYCDLRHHGKPISDSWLQFRLEANCGRRGLLRILPGSVVSTDKPRRRERYRRFHPAKALRVGSAFPFKMLSGASRSAEVNVPIALQLPPSGCRQNRGTPNTRCTRTPPRFTSALESVRTSHQRGLRRRILPAVATPVSFTVRWQERTRMVSPSVALRFPRAPYSPH